MPENTETRSPTDPGTIGATRLKSAVRARSLAEEGVALSMGATAVIIRGSQADSVWRALEPTLRTGFERSTLLARFPEKGQTFLAGILDELTEHGFLRDVEAEPVSLTEAEQAAFPHLEAATHRPYAALAALRTSVVRVRSSCPLLEAEVRRALARAGFGEVHADGGTEVETPVLLTTRITGDGGEEAEYVVAADGDLWLAGPRNRPGTPDLPGRLRSWFGSRKAAREPDRAALGVTRTLVASQLALALIAHVARSSGNTAPEPDPEFMVTTEELVSEPHTLRTPEPLDPGTLTPLPVPDPAAGSGEVHPPTGSGAAEPLEVPERLDAVTHLWDRVFGPVAEPRPEDLTQLPVGLALAGQHAGCGFTTAEARLDALIGALHSVVWRTPRSTGTEAGQSIGLGLGLTSVAAIGAAVGDLVLSGPEDRWKDVDTPALSPASRRLWAALTLRLGVPAELTVQEWDETGMWRARVFVRGAFDGTERPGSEAMEVETLGASAAPTPDACVREAVLRAVAGVRLREESPRTPLPPTATGTEEGTSTLARWAFATGSVRVRAPGGAAGWRDLGVHSAVATWT